MSGNYGIMVHFLPTSAPRSGEKQTDYNLMAREFPVEAFVERVSGMGATWVIFPFGQNSGFYWSPNANIEKRIPGRCSKRDLVLELAEALKKKRIRFIGYIPSEMDSQTEDMRNAFFWDTSSDKKEFMALYLPVIEEYGEKFGDFLDGWWFDGCYTACEKTWLRTTDWNNNRFDKKEWFRAAKAGNKNRIIAMCTGANHMGYVFEEEDYLAGETNNLDQFPWNFSEDKKQWHALTWLDCRWMHEEVGKIVPPRFTDEEIMLYVKSCTAAQGAVTLNIGIYEDGTMAEETVEQVKRIKPLLKD